MKILGISFFTIFFGFLLPRSPEVYPGHQKNLLINTSLGDIQLYPNVILLAADHLDRQASIIANSYATKENRFFETKITMDQKIRAYETLLGSKTLAENIVGNGGNLKNIMEEFLANRFKDDAVVCAYIEYIKALNFYSERYS